MRDGLFLVNQIKRIRENGHLLYDGSTGWYESRRGKDICL